MGTQTTQASSADVTRRRGYLAAAWLSLILVPVFFFLGFAAAHLPYLIWPFEEGSGEEPLWFGGITTGIFLIVLAIPLVFAVLFGVRAVRAGTAWGWLPAIVAACAGVLVLAVNLIGLVVLLVSGSPLG